MNIIKYETQKPKVTFGRLPSGTVFHYLGGHELYMKLEDSMEYVSMSRSVQLKNGRTYPVLSDKEVCPVPANTVLSIEVNNSCVSC